MCPCGICTRALVSPFVFARVRVCARLYLHVCTCTWAPVGMCTCARVCPFAFARVPVCICMCVCTVYPSACVRVHVYPSACEGVFLSACVRVHVCSRLDVFVCTCVRGSAIMPPSKDTPFVQQRATITNLNILM